MNKRPILLAALIISTIATSFADKPKYSADKTTDTTQTMAKKTITPGMMAGCSEPNGVTVMDFNNIRARIYTGGDMFWDKGLNAPAYEVPKGSGKSSMFLASLWLGGTDVNGQLRLAAKT